MKVPRLSHQHIAALGAVAVAHNEATRSHRPFASLHEAYAVLAEEVDELWAEVKKRPEHRDRHAVALEAAQVAAVAVRILEEFGPPVFPGKDGAP